MNFVGLLNCALMRELAGKTPLNLLIINVYQWTNSKYFRAWAANYNYWRQYFFVRATIFSISSSRGRCRQCFVVFESPLFMRSFNGAMSRNVCLKSGCHDCAGPEPRPLHWFSVTRPQGLDRDKAGQKKYGIYRLGRGPRLEISSQSNFDQNVDLCFTALRSVANTEQN